MTEPPSPSPLSQYRAHQRPLSLIRPTKFSVNSSNRALSSRDCSGSASKLVAIQCVGFGVLTSVLLLGRDSRFRTSQSPIAQEDPNVAVVLSKRASQELHCATHASERMELDGCHSVLSCRGGGSPCRGGLCSSVRTPVPAVHLRHHFPASPSGPILVTDSPGYVTTARSFKS